MRGKHVTPCFVVVRCECPIPSVLEGSPGLHDPFSHIPNIRDSDQGVVCLHLCEKKIFIALSWHGWGNTLSIFEESFGAVESGVGSNWPEVAWMTQVPCQSICCSGRCPKKGFGRA